MLNIRQIEVFRAVMECGSVSQAARRLNVSQPSVSKHLALLEERIGLSLFMRTGNKLVPRTEAVALHTQIEQLYSGLPKLNAFIADLSKHRHGEVQIAAMPLIAHRWLPEVIAPFLRAYPDVSASFPVRSSNWVNKWVAAGRADLGIAMTGDERGVAAEPLLRLPVVAVCSADHPLAQTSLNELADLNGQSIITLSTFDYSPTFFDDLLHPVLHRPGRRIQTFAAYVACEMARQGLGIALVDALTALQFSRGDAGLCVRAVGGGPSIEICLLSAAFWPRSALAEQMMGLMRQKAATTMSTIELMFETEG